MIDTSPTTRRGSALGVWLAFALGCGGAAPAASPPAAPAPAAQPTDAASARTLTLFQAYAAAVEAKDLDKLTALYADDAVVVPASSGMSIRGAANVAAFFGPFWDAFPDLESSQVVALASGDTAIGLGRARGTQAKPMMGIPATGKQTSFYGLEVIEFDAEGKLARQTVYADNLNFLGQLGLYQGPHRGYDDTAAPTPVTAVAGSGDEARNAEAITAWIAAFNAGEVAAVAAHYAPDATLRHQAAPADLSGADAVRQAIADMRAGFPDAKLADEKVWAAGPYVVATYVMTGTHQGDIAGLPATGKTIRLEVADLYRMQDGKIAEHWVLVDGMAMMIQLGAMKIPGT